MQESGGSESGQERSEDPANGNQRRWETRLANVGQPGLRSRDQQKAQEPQFAQRPEHFSSQQFRDGVGKLDEQDTGEDLTQNGRKSQTIETVPEDSGASQGQGQGAEQGGRAHGDPVCSFWRR
jgi:hypothetical protein